MGDDWENKFNSEHYECIYFKSKLQVFHLLY